MDSLGWHLFELGLIKLHTFPAEGTAIGKGDYYGIIVSFMWWFPIDRV